MISGARLGAGADRAHAICAQGSSHPAHPSNAMATGPNSNHIATNTTPKVRFDIALYSRRLRMDCQGFAGPRLGAWAGRPRTAGGRPSLASYFRQLARLNQFDENIPLVLGQDRQITGLANLHLLPGELHLRTRAAPGRAQEN